ncbi:MAG: hypothetical protein Fur0042_15110 [Cyanophyceae cyanobacterium]
MLLSPIDRATLANIALDLYYDATTTTNSRVARVVLQVMTEHFGNASRLDHAIGDRAEAAVKQAARYVADLVGATPRDGSVLDLCLAAKY